MFALFKRSKNNETLQKCSNEQQFDFDDSIALKILAAIKKEFGLDYSKQEYITMRKIERFALKNEIYDFQQLHNMLASSPKLKERLINMLTVGETYFYRELGHMEILAEFMQQNPVHNILCAPSSSGEEVYSILLYLQENMQETLSVTLVGIDLNSDAVNAAQQGCYSQRSISLLPLEIVQKYFKNDNSKFCIDSSIKCRASFRQCNIFDKSLMQLGTFEVIFSRNMLIYFNDKQKKEALANLRALLADGGILFIGHADISFHPEGFEKIYSPKGSYLKKI